MNKRLERYVRHRAKNLAVAYPQLTAEDLVSDSWVIYLDSGADNYRAFLRIRRRFNKIKMRAIRDARRLVSLDRLRDSIDLATDTEDALIVIIDLKKELKEIIEPTSRWKGRVAKEKARRYLGI